MITTNHMLHEMKHVRVFSTPRGHDPESNGRCFLKSAEDLVLTGPQARCSKIKSFGKLQ
jgi:hypothetical protein